jgi:predicted DNA-binding transcriptional regulator YafY
MLHPLLLVIQAPVIYLVGRLSGLDEIRVLAIHRFEEVTLRPDKEFRPKMRFNPDKWLEESLFNIEREQTEITFIMDKDVAFHLDETKLSNDQKYKKLRDGRSQVTATVRVSEELIWWFLGFGDCVEIVAPKKLRDKVAKRIRAAAELYD